MPSDRYQKYLESEDWRSKRSEKMNRRGGAKRRCAICGQADGILDVHHLKYAAELTAVPQSDLRVLCRRCHDLAHALIRAGVLKFTKDNDAHRFVLTKTAVKRALGIVGNQPTVHQKPHQQCCQQTRKQRACPIYANRQSADGRWWCHVHDPDGAFQRQKKLFTTA